MIISVGDGHRIGAALPELEALLADPLMTLGARARVQARRPGAGRAPPSARDRRVGAADVAEADGLHVRAVAARRPAAARQLVRRLREAGARRRDGLRGFWGYHGDHAPHGDRFWQLRRRVPVVTLVIDTPERSARGSRSSTSSPRRRARHERLRAAVHAPASLREDAGR